MTIDPESGCVTLPDGFVIKPDWTRSAMLSGAQGDAARASRMEDQLYLHGQFKGGEIEGHPVLVSACFYEGTLLYLNLCVSLYPPGAVDWESYSLDVEAAIKSLHDRLLTAQFGPPSRVQHLPMAYATPAEASLESTLTWEFPWGRVVSAHDVKGGGTSITVRYGNRLEEANKDYRIRTAPR